MHRHNWLARSVPVQELYLTYIVLARVEELKTDCFNAISRAANTLSGWSYHALPALRKLPGPLEAINNPLKLVVRIEDVIVIPIIAYPRGQENFYL